MAMVMVKRKLRCTHAVVFLASFINDDVIVEKTHTKQHC